MVNPKPIENIQVAIDLVNSLVHASEEDFKFIARRANIEATKAYNASPNDIVSVSIYAISLAALGNIDESIEKFKNEVIPKLNNKNKNSFACLVYMNYAEILTMKNKNKEALEEIGKIENLIIPRIKDDFKIKGKSSALLRIVLRIYFENGEYLKLIKFAAQINNLFKNYFIGDLRIFEMFSYYQLGYNKETLVLLIPIAKCLKFEEVNNSNLEELFIEISKIIKTSLFKKTLTIKEEITLSGIKELAILLTKYSLNEIYFTKNINFNGNEFVINFERSTDGGFSGEIKEIPGCFTQGDTIEELEENMLDVLDLLLNEEVEEIEA